MYQIGLRQKGVIQKTSRFPYRKSIPPLYTSLRYYRKNRNVIMVLITMFVIVTVGIAPLFIYFLKSKQVKEGGKSEK